MVPYAGAIEAWELSADVGSPRSRLRRRFDGRGMNPVAPINGTSARESCPNNAA